MRGCINDRSIDDGMSETDLRQLNICMYHFPDPINMDFSAPIALECGVIW